MEVTENKIREWLIIKISELTGIDKNKVDVDKSFSEYDLDSVSSIGLSGDLESFLSMKLNPMVLFEHHTINKLTKYLFEKNSSL